MSKPINEIAKSLLGQMLEKINQEDETSGLESQELIELRYISDAIDRLTETLSENSLPLRDQIAIAIFPAIYSQSRGDLPEFTATQAYKYADAMLQVRGEE